MNENVLNILEAIAEILNEPKKEEEIIDISTDEGYKKFNDACDEIDEAYDEFNFGDFKEVTDALRELASKLHDDLKKKEVKKEQLKEVVKDNEKSELSCKLNRIIEDHTEKKKFNRPSELLNIDQKLQLHKLVQEYIDEMVTPFNDGVLSQKQINDAYAGLYEFGAWILNK